MTKSLLITGATGSFGQEFISSLISEKNEWDKFITLLGYKYWDETNNKTYKLFLGASL